MIITNNSPSAGYIAWQDVVIKHKNLSYNVNNGNSNKKYIWWDFSTPTVLQETDTMPTMTDNDAIIFYNDSGTYHIVAVDTDIHGGLLIAGTVPGSALIETYVETTGNESIAGVKTFEDFPVLPSDNPATDFQAAHKKYVDDNAGGVSDHGELEGLGDDDHVQYVLRNILTINGDLFVLASDGSIAKLDLGSNTNVLKVNTAKDPPIEWADAGAPGAHHVTHENGGADEINVGGLSGELADNQPPKVHAASHTDATDDIQSATNAQKGLATAAQITKLEGIAAGADVTGANAPQAHKVSHQNAGSDEIDVGGLSGELADNQPPKAHKVSHESGGGDQIRIDNLQEGEDNNDLNSSIARHGLLRKLTNEANKFLDASGNWSVGGVADHGDLIGLADDDHEQYHNDARGDARYLQLSLFTTMGDIAVMASDGSVIRLPVGSNTQVLTANSARGAGMEWVDAGAPGAHHATHENDGADEVNVGGLSGELADNQPPKVHATAHQSGGGDAIKLDDLAAPDDNTDLNASAAKHGLMPKLDAMIPNLDADKVDGLEGATLKANEIIIMAGGFKIDGSACALVMTNGTAAKCYAEHLAVAKTEWFDTPKFRVPDTYDGGNIAINVCFRSAGVSKKHSLGIRVASVATTEVHNPDLAAAYQLYNEEASEDVAGEIKIKTVTVTQANHLMVAGEIWHCKFVMEDDAGADSDDVLIDWIVIEWNKG